MMMRERLALSVLVLTVGSTACRDSEVSPQGSSAPPAVPTRGAKVAWVEYQAEAGQTNARREATAIEAEAVGREAVRLEKVGDYVAFTATKAANSIVVRLAIPDAPTGGGLDATLGLYVKGQRVQTLAVTSRYAWVYQGAGLDPSDDPARGEPHAFFDEVRARVDGFPAGTEVKLQKDDGDAAAFYVIDLVDLELVAPPLSKPADLLSITDHGATPDDGGDDGEAIQRALDAAVAEGWAGVWIPPGTFRVDAERLSLQGLQVRGAGMWYSTLQGRRSTLSCPGAGGCHFADFSLLGEGSLPDARAPAHGFDGELGEDTVIENVWVEHVAAGIWSGAEGSAHPTDGLVVKGSRFRDLTGQGIRLAHGTRNSVVEHSHFRNTGGDALVIGAEGVAGEAAGHDNVLRHNSVQMSWRGNCFALLGGSGNTLEDSTCEGDTGG